LDRDEAAECNIEREADVELVDADAAGGGALVEDFCSLAADNDAYG
jgi:hypothetical protein